MITAQTRDSQGRCWTIEFISSYTTHDYRISCNGNSIGRLVVSMHQVRKIVKYPSWISTDGEQKYICRKLYIMDRLRDRQRFKDYCKRNNIDYGTAIKNINSQQVPEKCWDLN